MTNQGYTAQQFYAGFGARLAALWIDGLIVWAVVMLVVLAARRNHVYLPIELSCLICGMVYWVVLTGWQGRTAGKALCGLRVVSNKGNPPGYARAVLRECIGKPVSAVFLLLGFFWVALSKSKRGWHDYLAQTHVTQERPKLRRMQRILFLIIIITLVWMNPIRLIKDYRAAREMAVNMDNVITTYSQRDPSLLVDVNSLESADLGSYVHWLNENSKDPLEYAVESAARHKITILGEAHWLQDNLSFFNRIIPDLYHRAGITCVALEACVPEDNDKLAKLVTSDRFDRELALEIARNGDSWKDWGRKGYWDIFETVWSVNQGLPEDAVKMSVVGIGIKFDGPSMALSLGKYMDPGPLWEKLRLFSLLDDFVTCSMVEGLYAANVARETIEIGRKGVVLVGGAHSSLDQLYPSGKGKELTGERPRMGFMLHEKYGDQVYQILFHNEGLLHSNIISEFIEQIASQQDNEPFGCDMKGSPFGKLRDSRANHFQLQPGLCVSDIAAGYIYIKPISNQKRCEWLDGYISENMFLKYKFYYETKVGRTLGSPKDADKAFRSYRGW
jgi:uncharacterized RDD family membrane protein YckC